MFRYIQKRVRYVRATQHSSKIELGNATVANTETDIILWPRIKMFATKMFTRLSLSIKPMRMRKNVRRKRLIRDRPQCTDWTNKTRDLIQFETSNTAEIKEIAVCSVKNDTSLSNVSSRETSVLFYLTRFPRPFTSTTREMFGNRLDYKTIRVCANVFQQTNVPNCKTEHVRHRAL